MTAALFEVSATDVADTSDDCYTPRWIFDAAGLIFDMDVAAPVNPVRRICPALRYLTPVEDGLRQPWEGVVWMNPPFGRTHSGMWVERFARHRSGLALVPWMIRATWIGPMLSCADAITTISTDFIRPDGSRKEILWPLILAACGPVAVEALGRVAAADKYVRGAYHVRPGGLR
jgi:hypothetical protein